MPSFEANMKETKETLATRLANRSNGSATSKYNPFKQDGINLVTLGQETGLILNAFTSTTGGPNHPVQWIRDKNYGEALKEYVHGLFRIDTLAGKALWGSTAIGFVSNALKRRGRTIRSGLLKLA